MEKRRVLYIEDEDAQRKKLSSRLRSKGYKVTIAASGQTGLSLFKNRNFDVILCDLNMPEMGGLEVLEKIRQRDSDIPFIILSAHGTTAQAVKAVKKGASQFVLKPIEINQLIITIEQGIEKTNLQKKMQDSQAVLQMVLENVPDIIYSLNYKGEFLSLSPSAESSMGYKPSELIGTSVFKVMHPGDRERVKESFMRSVKSVDTKVKTLLVRMVAKTGETEHFELKRKMVFENGRLIRNDGVARKVTQRMILEQKLKGYHEEMAKANLDLLTAQQKLEDKNADMENMLKEMSKIKDELQTIIDTNPSVIILVDKNGTIRESNKSVTDFFGLSLDEVVNTNFDEFNEKIKSNFEDYDKFYKQIKFLKKNPDCSTGLDLTEIYGRGVRVIKHKPGILSPTCCRVQDKDNGEIGLLWIYNDVTLIQNADEQVHTIVNSSPIPTIISRFEDGKILYANEELSNLVGLTSKELVGRHSPDFYYNPEDRKKVKEGLKRDGYIRNFETRIKKVDGSVIWMIFSVVITKIGSDEVMLGWLYDISERKKTEEAIAARLKYEEGLATCSRVLLSDIGIKDAIPAALNHLLKASDTSRVYIFENFEDPEDGLCLRLTHEVCATGVSSNLDDPLLQHGPYKQGFERWRKALSQGKSIQGFIESFPQSERVILEPQGILSILVLPLWVEGKWYGFIGFDDVKIRREWNEEDIRLLQTAAEIVGTYIERKKVDMALRESEERFRSLVEEANDIIYSLTPEGIFSYVSPNWTEILGHDVSEVQGKSFVPFVHPDDLQACMEFFQNVMELGKKQSGVEYRVKHKDKSWRWHTSNASPLKDEEGKAIAFIGIAHDITEMKKAMEDLERSNQNLKDAQAQLVQSEKMAALGSLVAGIAHEINTPIGAVSSMHDTLFRTLERLKSIIESQFRKKYEQLPRLKSTFKIIDDSNKVVRSGTKRVINLVRRLKSFARLDEAELKTADIHEGLEDTLILIHHEIKHNITVLKNFGNVPPISCFPGQLNQVFLNLFINSKQAIKGKGTISITTFVKNNKAHIVIKDDGVGIPKDQLKKIFDPGFTTKGRGVGAGLGLSICYQIIQDHRGEIKAESVLGKGATFTIVLPMNLDDILERESQD
jgi:PAS domain S-box-containing protein